jgi:hypothetical protein
LQDWCGWLESSGKQQAMPSKLMQNLGMQHLDGSLLRSSPQDCLSQASIPQMQQLRPQRMLHQGQHMLLMPLQVLQVSVSLVSNDSQDFKGIQGQGLS